MKEKKNISERALANYNFVLEEKAKLETFVLETKWKTNLHFRFVESNQNESLLNLHTADIPTLLKIATHLISLNAAFEAAQDFVIDRKVIYKEKFEFYHQGYLLDDWLQDIRNLISKKYITSKLQFYNSKIGKAQNLLDSDLKREIEVDEFTKELGL